MCIRHEEKIAGRILWTCPSWSTACRLECLPSWMSRVPNPVPRSTQPHLRSLLSLPRLGDPMRFALVAGISMFLVSCGGSGSGTAPPPTHQLTSAEVSRLFTEWACPGRPDLARPLLTLVPNPVDPESQADSLGGRWTVFTSSGSVTFRESTKTFTPSDQAGKAVAVLQGTGECRAAAAP